MASSLDGKPLLTSEEAWQKLANYYENNKSELDMPSMFRNDPERFKKFR